MSVNGNDGAVRNDGNAAYGEAVDAECERPAVGIVDGVDDDGRCTGVIQLDEFVAKALRSAQTELTDDECSIRRRNRSAWRDQRPPRLPGTSIAGCEEVVALRAGILLNGPEVDVVERIGLRCAVVAPAVLTSRRVSGPRSDVVG